MKTLIAMGGALNHDHPAVLGEFVQRAGGGRARIAILPQASALQDTGFTYENIFLEMGVAEATTLGFRQRSEADLPGNLEIIQKSSAIFITGGVQMRLAALIGGTKLEAQLHTAYEHGTVIGGTSAGAAILSRLMVAYGRSGPTPRERIAQYLPGFGFTDRVIFDQHFRQRDRLGRLIYAVAAYPGLLGVGIDEDTATILVDDDEISIVGAGAVTILDGSQIIDTNIAEIEKQRPVAVSSLVLHILTGGCTYRISTRHVSISTKEIPLE